MRTRPAPSRVALVLGLSAVLLGTATACRPTLSGAAATVGATRITDSELTRVVEDGYSTQVQTMGTSREEFQRAKLTEFVTSALDAAVASRLGVTLTDQLVAETRTEVEDASGGPDKLATAGLQNGYGPGALDDYIRHAALKTLLTATLLQQSPPSDEYLRAQFAASSSDSADLSVIYVATSDLATTVFNAATANPASFAALAMQYSDDPTSKAAGGEVGPQARSSLPDDLATQVFSAKADAILTPLPLSATEIAVIKVNSVTVSSFDDQRAALLAAASAPGSDYAKGLLTTAETAAEGKDRITVSKRYGVWNPESLQVEPSDSELSAPKSTAPAPAATDAVDPTAP